MRELHSLGFKEVAQCEEALRQSAGEVKGALSLLQRPLLEPFHQRIWSEQVEPPIDPKHQDKQVLSPGSLNMCQRVYGRVWFVIRTCFFFLLFVLSTENVPASAGPVQPAQLGSV